jgi:hypothetical protein
MGESKERQRHLFIYTNMPYLHRTATAFVHLLTVASWETALASQ